MRVNTFIKATRYMFPEECSITPNVEGYYSVYAKGRFSQGQETYVGIVPVAELAACFDWDEWFTSQR